MDNIDILCDQQQELMEKLQKADDLGRSIPELIDFLRRSLSVMDRRLTEFHFSYGSPVRFSTFVQKVVTKYESDAYKNRFRGRNPPVPQIYGFLTSYAQDRGRLCHLEEMGQYGTPFTQGMVFLEGFYFRMDNGQGVSFSIIPQLKNHEGFAMEGGILYHRPVWKVLANAILVSLQWWTKKPVVVASKISGEFTGWPEYEGWCLRRIGQEKGTVLRHWKLLEKLVMNL